MVEEKEQIRIGIAEGAILATPGTLMTAGLGSCVGLVIYDDSRLLAGMVHIMLPESPHGRPSHPQKYADTGIAWLYETLMEHGASHAHLRAKYAGGSQMFQALQMEALRIGERNVRAVSMQLERLRIPVLGADVGGNVGRTVWFELPSRHYLIRTARGDERQM
ncbi:putative chemoreceptor glutamine deamidase CheD [Alicyclobacillus hesperidum]|uniref:Probable chemoreceptor glutamine deamidase CheD n=1 Tax=Alicyclobacillus hesperidum TaxID=89784 RepID=A0A1H2SI15_9BACL|nr:chemotaxis protein CheD [Alicyclobacillus hesperidum]GLV12385.1 putative chemoreceptor glutamine deamidase CheD [Alicyclobacillus hesperidum]SDW31158.1 chemotaxis protein CheD [Alicyclobacillus hesperidum]